MKIGPAIVRLLVAVLCIFIPASATDAPWIRDFRRVSCNDNLSTAICKSWQQVFGTLGTFSRRVVIPCGACVLFDTPRESIRFTSGLDIQGKLVVVPPTNNDDRTTTMYASAIIVQGELVVDTRKTKQVVDGTPSVRFFFTGETEELFTPIGENEKACFGSPFCLAGKKSITVAGGQVTRKCSFELSWLVPCG